MGLPCARKIDATCTGQPMYNSRRSGGLEEMQEAQKRASQSKKTSRKHVPASLEESAADIAFGPAPDDARKWHRRTLNLCVELAGLPALATVITLAPLLEEPLQTASRNSGYTEAARHSNNVRLYVWVWVPAYPGEVTQATWENVLNNMTTWIQGVSCEQPPGGAPPQPAVAGSPAS